MRFTIKRASEQEPPCTGAVKEDEDWFVDIETIEELMALREQLNTDLVLGKWDSGPRIVIYDDYME